MLFKITSARIHFWGDASPNHSILQISIKNTKYLCILFSRKDSKLLKPKHSHLSDMVNNQMFIQMIYIVSWVWTNCQFHILIVIYLVRLVQHTSSYVMTNFRRRRAPKTRKGEYIMHGFGINQWLTWVFILCNQAM